MERRNELHGDQFEKNGLSALCEWTEAKRAVDRRLTKLVPGSKQRTVIILPLIWPLLPAAILLGTGIILGLAVQPESCDRFEFSLAYLFLLIGSAWRFMDRRFKRTRLTYELFLALGRFPSVRPRTSLGASLKRARPRWH